MPRSGLTLKFPTISGVCKSDGPVGGTERR